MQKKIKKKKEKRKEKKKINNYTLRINCYLILIVNLLKTLLIKSIIRTKKKENVRALHIYQRIIGINLACE